MVTDEEYDGIDWVTTALYDGEVIRRMDVVAEIAYLGPFDGMTIDADEAWDVIVQCGVPSLEQALADEQAEMMGRPLTAVERAVLALYMETGRWWV